MTHQVRFVMFTPVSINFRRKHMKKLFTTFVLLITAFNLYAQDTQKDSLSLDEFETEMREAADRTSAKTNLGFCLANVSKDFYNWGCERAVKDAIRANIELDYIITKLVLKAMNAPEGIVFDQDNVDEKALAADIKHFLSKIGRINEANIDEVSARINDEAQHLGRLHYSYSK